jgi:hypothetical protein
VWGKLHFQNPEKIVKAILTFASGVQEMGNANAYFRNTKSWSLRNTSLDVKLPLAKPTR